MKYKHKLLIARDIGRLFGKSSHEVNKTLEKLGYRDPKSKYPTGLAKEMGLSGTVAVEGYLNTAWDPIKLVPILLENGYQLKVALPEDLVEAPSLMGPFECVEQSLFNNDGDRIAFFENKKHADVVCKILNIAATTGKLERMLVK
jgi:hypothetical protein